MKPALIITALLLSACTQSVYEQKANGNHVIKRSLEFFSVQNPVADATNSLRADAKTVCPHGWKTVREDVEDSEDGKKYLVKEIKCSK